MPSIVPRFLACIMLPLAGMACGCGDPPKFTVSTVVRADGLCERTTIQPRSGYLPNEARPAEAKADSKDLSPEWMSQWDSVTSANRPPAATPADAPLEAHAYFKASGKFTAPADIPLHYRYLDRNHPEAGVSNLVREFERTDFGLFVEYRWTESVTNNVTRERFDKSIATLLDKSLPEFSADARRALRENYDTTSFEDFLLHDGRATIADLATAYYDARIGKLSDEVLTERLIATLDKRGLRWEKDNNDPLNKLMTDIGVRYLRRHDGKAMTAEEAAKALDAIGGDLRSRNRSENHEDRTPGSENFGYSLFAPTFGVYPLFYLFGQQETFAFTLELPGTLIETNGLILVPNRTSWKFEALDTFPMGYHMTARSLQLNPAAQEKLLGRVVVDDVATAAIVIDLVGREGRLLKTLQKAIAENSLAPLRTLQATDTDEMKRLGRLLEILAPP